MDNVQLKEAISSKKFLFVIGSVWAMFLFAALAAWKLNMMTSMYDAFVGGVIALAGMYLTGNVANKYVVGKHVVAKAALDAGSDDAADDQPPVEPVPEEKPKK